MGTGLGDDSSNQQEERFHSQFLQLWIYRADIYTHSKRGHAAGLWDLRLGFGAPAFIDMKGKAGKYVCR